MTVTIDLPWPPRDCLPNVRVHWTRRARAAKHQRTTAAYLTMQSGFRRGDWDIPGAIKATITFHAPDNRRRDLDNMLSSLKSGIDGIADILGCDDSKWEIAIRKAAPVKGGSVRIELEAA